MYKKAAAGMVLVNVLLIVSCWCTKYAQGLFAVQDSASAQILADYGDYSRAEEEKPDKSLRVIGIADVAVSEQRVVEYSMLERQEFVYSLDEQEFEVLCRIVEAEAGDEDENGKLLVANVVLNRVANEEFPDTVSGVVFQKSNGVTQFSPVSNGQYGRVDVSDETVQAVLRALKGEDISEGALFFMARRYADSEKVSWFDNSLRWLFAHGGHEFYTYPEDGDNG